MTDGPPSPKRVKTELDDLSSLSKEDLVLKLQEQNDYIKHMEIKKTKTRDEGSEEEGKDSDDKLKQQSIEAARRENTLVMRLTNKEQELQDCMNQIQEMKAGQTTSMAQLRTMLLDPAVNLVFQRITKEMDDCKDKLKQTQNELSAWKFTPDSQTGKRLMVKCRMLLQENEELGKMIASGKTAKLEGEIALQKTLVTEMKKGQEEMDEFVADLEEDVEGMQSMIYVLQQQLKDTKEQLTQLQTENEQLRKNTSAVPNGITMETNNTVVPMETKSYTDQSAVISHNSSLTSCPDNHLSSANNLIANTSDTPHRPIVTHDSISRSNDGLVVKTKDRGLVDYSGNGNYDNYDNSERDTEEEEAMETDNITDCRNELKQIESDSRIEHKNHRESQVETVETTCNYDSSDTWSPQPWKLQDPDLEISSKSITNNAQDSKIINGIDKSEITKSESDNDL
ncbi:pre-mRNA-splicing regulator WTAP [Patella vulgata]|uniref:pre-mRNA-splicing regulator WTAP n=1 Tax=Patella vulgata TaxID=6465 RepID=UPI00217FDF2A|nr:pre-mRNA-splicing regulator WTAP [Patella vulgata]XP_050390707.1 pre-mRNA-splicing regulator WTAP [Patella vulgata]